MSQVAQLYPDVTERALRLARLLFPILVQCAKDKTLITYGALVERAQEMYPDVSEVQNAIPVSMGRILDVIHVFCARRGIPDLASIVVSSGSTFPGRGYVDFEHADERQREVFAFDWEAEFIVFEEEVIEAIRVNTRKPRSEKVAAQLLVTHFLQNETQYPATVRDHKATILALLMEGFDAHEAFDTVLR